MKIERLVEHVRRSESAKYRAGFADWLLNHEDVWARFCKAAHEVRARNITNYSAFVIVNVLRYRADTEGKKFAMTNTYVPDMARLYNAAYGTLFNISTRKKTGEVE